LLRLRTRDRVCRGRDAFSRGDRNAERREQALEETEAADDRRAPPRDTATRILSDVWIGLLCGAHAPSSLGASSGKLNRDGTERLGGHETRPAGGAQSAQPCARNERRAASAHPTTPHRRAAARAPRPLRAPVRAGLPFIYRTAVPAPAPASVPVNAFLCNANIITYTTYGVRFLLCSRCVAALVSPKTKLSGSTKCRARQRTRAR
jgi:hypothetical protein